MSTSIAVPRTAPIAIAPKPPTSINTTTAAQTRFPPSRQGSIHNHHHFDSASYRSGFNSPDSGSVQSLNTPPCEACRARRSDCVMGEDAEEHCVACQYSGTDCSLVDGSSPLGMRKRKLNGIDSAEEGRSKRR
ncbi:hypothetical protein QBC41DRAFT_360416 [Cercophora samala]|uniref:Zn(2)-C6 fungal-type domain-containing protein n=1 Tax=Cercophora samala TaxID=330535 RepID=A0AA39YV32_9PEZI|nr:hypothetical protein QBC41DRAFT_360416 [Cercophora samala]